MRAALAPRGWTVTLAEAPPGSWSKGAAAAPAIAASTAATIVVADADVWTAGLERAIARVAAGAPWAVPHGHVYRLTAHATAEVLAGERTIAPGLPTDEPPYEGLWGGGIVVLPRELALDVPLDPRFAGWGQEDVSWAIALAELAGPGWRGTDPLFHLWHPPQPRMSRGKGSPAGLALARGYRAAQGNPGAMRALIEEAKCSTSS